MLCASVVVSLVTADEVTTRYLAGWRDGSTSESVKLDGWIVEKRPATIDGASVNGRRLFDPLKPVASLRIVGREPLLVDSYLEFVGGDILPGKIVTEHPASQTSDSSVVMVAVANPLATKLDNNIVRVRADSIARVVTTKRQDTNHSAEPITNGLVVYQDEQRKIARQIQWTSRGIRFLGDESVETVTWEHLAEVHVSRPDHGVNIRRSAAIRHTQIRAQSQLDLMARMTTTGGAVLTYHSDRVRSMKLGSTHYHLVQPAWAANGILVPVKSLAIITYRNSSTVPLSSLPAKMLAARHLIGPHRRWRRNRDVYGLPLSVGRRSAITGVGTHSHSEVTTRG